MLIDADGVIIAGHGRCMAADLLKMDEVPCIVLDGLTDAQKRAYVIADNKLALNAGWSKDLLELEMKELDALGFDLELTGFSDTELEAMLGEKEGIEQPEIVFSEEIDEAHNYVVLTFDNEIDWLAAQSHFGLESKYSTRANGKPWSKGVGRVINGGEYLSKEGR